jgi:hypothetical protein
MSPALRAFYLVVLISAVVFDAAVLYFLTDSAQRMALGLLLLPLILWAGTRLEVMQLLADRPRWGPHGRRFRELRSQVVILLEHVRRLNWIAVDAEHGFRNRDEALREMDAIEEQLRALVTEVRRAAGKPADEPDMSPAEEPETVE